jgi:hypothetical protein
LKEHTHLEASEQNCVCSPDGRIAIKSLSTFLFG